MIPTAPAMTRKTISTPKARARILFVLIGPDAQMQKEDEVDADLRQGEHNQADRYARGPQQIRLRHDERSDRQAGWRARAPPCTIKRWPWTPGVRRRASGRIGDRHRPSAGSHQVNRRDHPDPDNVQRVPEQAEAQQAPQYVRPQALGDDLRHHIGEPEEAARSRGRRACPPK